MARSVMSIKLWFVSVLFVLPLALQPQNGAAFLQGAITDRRTSEGIVDASVLLTGIVDDQILTLTTKTTTGGQFFFKNVPPSAGYWLIASHDEVHLPAVY